MRLEQLIAAKNLPFLAYLKKSQALPDKELEKIAESVNDEGELEETLHGYLDRDRLLLLKSLYFNNKFECIDLLEVQHQLDDEVAGLLSREQMLEHRVILLQEENKRVSIAIADPTDSAAVKFVEDTTGYRVVDRYLTLARDIKFIISQNRLVTVYLFGEGLIGEEEYKKINSLLREGVGEIEDLFLRYAKREQLLEVKALINGNKYDSINLLDVRDGLNIDSVSLLSKEEMLKYHIMILHHDKGELAIAMDDPSDNRVVRTIEKITENKVTRRYVTLDGDIRDAVNYLERKKKNLEREKEIATVESEDASLPAFDIMDLSDFSLGGDAKSPVRTLLEAVIKQALVKGASDIHIEPTLDHFLKIRYRIDGILNTENEIDELLERNREPNLPDKLVSVVKVLSGEAGVNMRLDVSDKPQDGRVYIPDYGLDLRIVALPSYYGESLVIRILRSDMGNLSLDRLGFEPKTYVRFRDVVEMPYGMLLISGPTGSGKSTTLYAILQMINSPEKKVLTIEDPVEYSMPGAMQHQINSASGFTFDVALRAFVRSDPDIIMVGEIRDTQTAAMAMESALTGHLVLSSVHAKDAISTVYRLKDIGVDTRLITATLNATLAQRLVRKNCKHCKRPFTYSTKLYQAMERMGIKFDSSNFYKGTGCSHCHYTGYQGRMGIYELLEMTREMKELFLEDAPSETILQNARLQQNMQSLMECALIKVARGITTEDEVWRVTLLENEIWKKLESE